MIGLWDKLIRDAFSNPLDSTRRQAAFSRPDLSPPTDLPYQRDASEIIAIQQVNAKGFRTVDIDPNLLDRENFYCQLLESVVRDYTGPEFGSESLGYGTESNIAPYWRTVEIPAQATFLKVEYLPSRATDFFQGQFRGVNPQNRTDSPVSGSNENFTVKYAGSQIVLINFDDASTAPLIAKHGDTFKIPFNTVYLTLKTWGPRVRLTFGYNTEIVSQGDDRIIGSQLAFSPGNGVLNNQFIHPVPFCFTLPDLGGTTFRLPDTGTSSDIEPLIVNDTGSVVFGTNDRGVLYGWITGFATSLRAASAGVYAAQGTVELCLTNASGSTIKRRLAALPFTFSTGGLTQSAAGVNEITGTFTEPVRFAIHQGEALCIRIQGFILSTVSPDYVLPNFTVTGYTMGPLYGSGVGAAFTPFIPQFKLADESFPLDRDANGNPRT